jgi:inner membrane transporter RhtA
VSRYRASLLVVVAAVSLQSGSAVATRLFDALGAPGLLALRMGFGAVLLGLVTRAWRDVPSRGAWPLVVAFGLVLGTMNLLFYLSLERIPLGVSVALELLGPLTVAVLGTRRARDLVWVGVAVLGVAVLVAPEVLPALGLGGAVTPLDPLGVVLALAAGACWGGYIVLGTRLSGVVAGSTGLAWAMLAASVVLVPLGVGTAGSALLVPALLLAGLGVALLSAALPYALEMSAMRAVGASTFGVMMSLEPAIAALAGLVIGGQRLAPGTLVGMALVVVAVFAALGRPGPARPGGGQVEPVLP